ncbi:hypothetical protein MAP00_002426 [Monascus purpureus]|nr:hypothetical protein MAP00_002426 [Monascus purpureus]
MSQSIKLDTSVQTIKRGLPEDNEEGLEGPGVAGDVEQEISAPGLEARSHNNVPPFLCQSYLDIHKKFEELEWLQRSRLAEGLLADDPSHRWALEADPEVKARNRYLNVQAWANSRIHLKVPDGECDFINASPITLRDSVTYKERRYIATQGPKLGHITHFWHMLFHETNEVAVIVMLTQTYEAGREKCAQYFPLNAENSPMILRAVEPNASQDKHVEPNGEVLGKVTLLESTFNEKSGSEVRKLELTMGSESKIVWHFLYVSWPDYSKPEASGRAALLQLIKLSASKCTPDNPRVVHCSAGVGRTGTFIALDHLLNELESGELLKVTDPETDPVFETVNQLREQRMMMVYNEMQLQFIYEVLREQADLKLGNITEEDIRGVSDGQTLNRKSAKIAKLSGPDYVPPSKAEFEPVSDRIPTPTRSWSGTPDVSDNE